MKKNYEIDFTTGNILRALISFTIPLMLSNMLQLFYNAADIIVVGRFAGKEALAAVGSTSSLINLLANILVGLSIGSNVLVSNGFGKGDKNLLERAVHTALLLSIISGVVIGIIGVIFSKNILILMKSPPDVIDKAALYLKIYFAGIPAIAVYNFGSSILRAVGDTKRPFIFLAISGMINVVLNLVFVLFFGMDVDGVAYATIISQIFAAFMVIRCLMKTDGAYKLTLSKLKIHMAELSKILTIGIPSGIQGSLFSISNILIQSSINSFGSIVVAGASAASNLENFIYMAMNAVYNAALTFTAQNLSASNPERIKKGVAHCLILTFMMFLFFGSIVLIFKESLLSLYSNDLEVIKAGAVRINYMCSLYFLCGFMEVIVGFLRGLSYSITPMLISLIGACGFRILWIYTIFAINPTLETLYISYPISWLLTSIAQYIALMYAFKKHNIIQKKVSY